MFFKNVKCYAEKRHGTFRRIFRRIFRRAFLRGSKRVSPVRHPAAEKPSGQIAEVPLTFRARGCI